MANGSNDLGDLFQRVTALEQDDTDSDQTVTQIIKSYPRLGIRVTMTAYLHQYRKCGDTQPLYGATCGTNTFL